MLVFHAYFFIIFAYICCQQTEVLFEAGRQQINEQMRLSGLRTVHCACIKQQLGLPYKLPSRGLVFGCLISALFALNKRYMVEWINVSY